LNARFRAILTFALFVLLSRLWKIFPEFSASLVYLLQRLLRDDFSPSLEANIMSGNKGRLVVPAASIQKWLEVKQCFSLNLKEKLEWPKAYTCPCALSK